MAAVLDGDDHDHAGPIGRVDPRARIVAAVVFAVAVVSCRQPAALGLGLGFAFALMLLARLPVAATLRRMAAMDLFVVVMLLTLPFTMPGDVVFELAGFPASRQGLDRALEIALKANAVVLALLALVGSMSPVTLGHALHRLRLPANLVHLLLFTVRYIDVLHQEYQRLRTAMTTRGFRPSTSLHTLRSFGYLVGMMLVRALERSERILAAMTCRGFAGTFPLFDDFRLGGRDWAFAALVLSACAMTVAVEML
ncbi:cobalt ECF transporter T component CbiQ [Magnetospirillum sp. UT-4]|uniref:cobalt ECF transporter T component CbiQ n=1 Tax=Magnetospirillum sp. UT-4 TaxID=2681467 RepID=UPI00137D55FD|nr:cobalt ECF transporter T component CbiQ [Magnetospirillum sp. UT-4]CAA7612077.1 Cobalt ABC transporter, permease protein CbiQ [Magnetospirillum sp. UT-4]